MNRKKEVRIRFLEIPTIRFITIILTDFLFIVLSFFISYYLRFEGKIPEIEKEIMLALLPYLVIARLTSIFIMQLHRWSFRYAGFHDALRIIMGISLGTMVFLSLIVFFHLSYPPRSVVALEYFFTTLFLGGYRFLPRFLENIFIEFYRAKFKNVRRTLIIGAGSSGELLLRDLRRSFNHPYKIIGFIDDDPLKVGKFLSGYKILGPIDKLSEIAKKYEISDILIAIPNLEPKKIKEILDKCTDLKLRYKVLPVSFSYLKDRISASMLQDLQPEDLLPREPVPFEEKEIRALIEGRKFLVTGAAGSIGSEISRQLSKYGAKEILLLDINENELYFLYRELKKRFEKTNFLPLVADIRDRNKMFKIGEIYKPTDILHAAAHKHVPLMEISPDEAVKNNVFGTLNLCDMALHIEVEKFVFISTDKAVNPTSVMGVTKRIGEFIVREKGKLNKTYFTAVRFGNVLGSAGSVVPLFKKQIAEGGPVTVTHPEMKRYFMTIEEAVGLVLLAGLGKYGELCVLDMGEPIKILDLARHMITMAGLVPDQDIKIVFTGLRAGEKLCEDLMTELEESTQLIRKKIMVAKSFLPENLDQLLEELKRVTDEDPSKIKEILKKIVPKYVERDNSTEVSVF